MDIMRGETRETSKGPDETFTGTVTMERLFEAPDPAQVAAVRVTFEPGARTAWHTHPLGQTLYITDGEGRVQKDGGSIEAVGPGDVVMFAPGEKHWHGAAPDAAMTHIAIQERQDGEYVDWLEHVSDEEYEGKP